jgi:hypothetical protein
MEFSVAAYDGIHHTESASVPDALLKPYTDMLGAQQRSGKFTAPALRAMRSTGRCRKFTGYMTENCRDCICWSIWVRRARAHLGLNNILYLTEFTK